MNLLKISENLQFLRQFGANKLGLDVDIRDEGNLLLSHSILSRELYSLPHAQVFVAMYGCTIRTEKK